MQAKLGDLLVALQQGFLQFRDPLPVLLLHSPELLAEDEDLLIALHDPGGGEAVQMGTLVAMGAFPARGRVRAASHLLLRLQGEDLPVQV
ncbi:MAG: hypothetical protein ABSH20_16140 [Tepidisphaeraceae bacterium]|jgi:hypothetical protein